MSDEVINTNEEVIEQTGSKEEALAALEVLGFMRKQAEKVVDKIVQAAPESLSVEDIIKQALKSL